MSFVGDREIGLIMRFFENIKIKRAFGLNVRTGMYRVFAFRCNNSLDIQGTLKKFSSLYSDNGLKAGEYLFGVYESVASGNTIAAAFEGILPQTELSIIASGEKNGDLGVGFSNACFFCESQDRVKKPAKAVVKSIVGWFSVMFGFILLMSSLSAETYKTMNVVNLPWFAQWFVSFSGFLRDYWWLVITSFIGVVSYTLYRLPRGFGKLRTFLQKYIFPFPTYRKYVVSSFLISLSSLISGGNDLKESLKFLRDNSFPYLASFLDLMYLSSSSGGDEEEVFDVGLLAPILMVNLVDLTKLKESKAIKNLAVHMINETVESFEALQGYIKTFMVIFMALILLWSYASFFVPIADQAVEAMNAIPS